MATSSSFETPLWARFKTAARRRRRDPERLLMDYMRECLEVWGDQQLDEDIRRDMRRSGRRESDAVQIVRTYRREKRG